MSAQPSLTHAERVVVEGMLRNAPPDALPTLQQQQIRIYYRLAHCYLGRGDKDRAHAWVRWCDSEIAEALAFGRLGVEAQEEYIVRRRIFETCAKVPTADYPAVLNACGMHLVSGRRVC